MTLRIFRRGIFALVAALLLATPLLAADPDMTDVGIQNAIENEMLFDPTVPIDPIDLSVSDGVVTLTGTVDTLLAKERAARIARAVRGVRSVVNRIDVQPSEMRLDAAIRNDVQTSLLADPATESYEVDVEVTNGTVTLGGTVDSWQEKRLVETVAKSVRGVRAVVNEIDVDFTAERSDFEIQQEVEKALEWDVLVDHYLIDISVSNGEVTLTGTAGNAAEKNRAMAKAWAAAGVTNVDASGLEVAGWADDEDMRTYSSTFRSDDEIQTAVEDALLLDPRVNSFDVATAVDTGVVTLRGVVDNLKAKRAATEDARNTVGVRRVENRIKVRPVENVLDREIEADVLAALARNSVVESYEVDVDVSLGTVTLSGEVDSYLEKFEADDVASRVPGVIRVVNNIDVEYDNPFSAYDPYDPYVDEPYQPYFFERDLGITSLRTDAEIQEAVENELWWSPFVDSDQVDVSVDDGVVTLAGVVDDWAEMSAAIENAYEGGAVAVDNDLVIPFSES